MSAKNIRRNLRLLASEPCKVGRGHGPQHTTHMHKGVTTRSFGRHIRLLLLWLHPWLFQVIYISFSLFQVLFSQWVNQLLLLSSQNQVLVLTSTLNPPKHPTIRSSIKLTLLYTILLVMYSQIGHYVVLVLDS